MPSAGCGFPLRDEAGRDGTLRSKSDRDELPRFVASPVLVGHSEVEETIQNWRHGNCQGSIAKAPFAAGFSSHPPQETDGSGTGRPLN